jgi:hypothetical protein
MCLLPYELMGSSLEPISKIKDTVSRVVFLIVTDINVS